MESGRALRLTIAPLVMFGFLLWADGISERNLIIDYFNLGPPKSKSTERQPTESKSAVPRLGNETKQPSSLDVSKLLAATGLIVAIGFVVSSLTALVGPQLLGYERGRPNWNGPGGITFRLRAHSIRSRGRWCCVLRWWEWTDEKCAATVFENAYVPERMTQWFERRGNSFWISANCAVGLFLVLLWEGAFAPWYFYGGHGQFPPSAFWWFIVWFLCFLLMLLNAIQSVHEVRQMSEFCSRCGRWKSAEG